MSFSIPMSLASYSWEIHRKTCTQLTPRLANFYTNIKVSSALLTLDITGSISSLLLLRLELQSRVTTYLLGSSLDRLIRLFDVGKIYAKNQRRRGRELTSYFTGIDNVTSMVCKSLETSSSPKKSDDNDEEIWAGMTLASDQGQDAEVGDGSNSKKRHNKKPRLKAH